MPTSATVIPGHDTFLQAGSTTGSILVFFEDDGDSGYFYALEDVGRDSQRVIDALAVYFVGELPRDARPLMLRLDWSADGLVAGLSVDGSWHAVFDFKGRRGACRKDTPRSGQGWLRIPWSDQSIPDLLKVLPP